MTDALHEFSEATQTFSRLLVDTQQDSRENGVISFTQIRWYGLQVCLTVDAATGTFTFAVGQQDPIRVTGIANAATQLMGLIRSASDVRQ